MYLFIAMLSKYNSNHTIISLFRRHLTDQLRRWCFFSHQDSYREDSAPANLSNCNRNSQDYKYVWTTPKQDWHSKHLAPEMRMLLTSYQLGVLEWMLGIIVERHKNLIILIDWAVLIGDVGMMCMCNYNCNTSTILAAGHYIQLQQLLLGMGIEKEK